MDKIKKNVLPIVIIINILYLLVGSFLESFVLIDKLTLSYGFIFVLLPVNIIISIVFRKRFRKDIIYLLGFLIIVFGIISTIFAYDTNQALFGLHNWHEGLFMIIYYFSLFYLSSIVEKKDRKKIIYTIFSCGIVSILLGICQKFELFNVPSYTNGKTIFFNGLCGNPNFVATQLLLCISFSIGLFFESKKSIIYYLLTMIFMFGLLLSDTLSCLVGLIFVLIYLLIFSIKYKKIKKYLVLVLGLSLITTVLHFTKLTTLVDDLNIFRKETSQLVTGNYKDNDNFGTYRIFIWKKTLSRVPNYLMTGVGIDNFNHIMKGNLAIYRFNKPAEKAHNEYLQILITEGIYCLLVTLVFYLIIFKRSVVNSFKNKKVLLVLPLIGYFVQAFFNISVINVAPLVFITLGFNTKR